jgi:hypothetical protein
LSILAFILEAALISTLFYLHDLIMTIGWLQSMEFRFR